MYRVLICEDEQHQREGLKKHVRWEKYGFALPELCANGLEAEAALEQAHYDMLITDVCMPGMDGLRLMRDIREKHCDIYIVVISGYAEFTFAQEAVRCGAREYLLKPIHPESVEHLLAEFLREKELKQTSRDSGYPAAVRQCIECMEGCVETGISLDELAAQVHLNASYLSVLFKKETGHTISDYMAELQLRRACVLLGTADFSIGEVAAQTGGRTASNFSQWFRKLKGVSPVEYRRMLRSSGEL